MLEHIVEFDRHLFHFINHDLGNPFFDWLMPLLRNARFWIPLYVCLIVFFIWRYKKQGIIVIILLAAAAGFADFTSVHLGKYEVQRLRPCRDPVVSQTAVTRVPCGPGYSFPSTHAADHFAVAAFLSFVFFRRWRWIWLIAFLWAGSICFAQVYVGVHFPVDVTIGAWYGILVGWLFSLIFKKLQPNF
ncbi:MAG: phosphatase PAP2 family protein [Mucilaginibacter sp.]